MSKGLRGIEAELGADELDMCSATIAFAEKEVNNISEYLCLLCTLLCLHYCYIPLIEHS